MCLSWLFANSLEKTPVLLKIEDSRRRELEEDEMANSITHFSGQEFEQIL